MPHIEKKKNLEANFAKYGNKTDQQQIGGLATQKLKAKY